MDPEGLEPLGRASYLTNRHFDGSQSIDGSGRDFRNGVSIVGVGLLAGPGGGFSAGTTGLRYIILTKPELAAALAELGFGFAVGGDAGPRPNLCTGSLNGLRANVGAAGKDEFRKLPKRARVFKEWDEAAAHLQRHHGINPHAASERLHGIKASPSIGRGPADNILIDRTGNVYDPITRAWLGSLTEGGAR